MKTYHIGKLWRGRPRGQVIVLLCLSIFVIVAFTALAVDFGMMYLSKAKLSRAVDSLGLRLAGNISTNNTSNARVALEAMKANYPGFLGNVTWDDVNNTTAPASAMSVTPNSAGATIQITNGTDGLYITNTVSFFPSNNPIGKVVNISSKAVTKHYNFFLPVMGSNFNYINLSESASARRIPTIVCLILDVSGSMRGNNGYVNMPTAVINFVNNFKNTQDQDFMAVVTFSTYASLRWPKDYTTNPSGYPTNMIPENNFVTPITTFMTNTASAGGIPFAGSTCGQEGLRLAYNVVRNLVGSIPSDLRKDMRVFYILFTDGTFNTVRGYAKGPGYSTFHSTNTVPWFHKELVVNCLNNDFSPYTGVLVANSTNNGFSTTTYNLNTSSRFGNYATVAYGTNTYQTNLSWTNRPGICATIQNQSAKTSFAQWSNVETSKVDWPSSVPITYNRSTTNYSISSTVTVDGYNNTSYGGTNWKSTNANGYRAWTNQLFSAHNTFWNPNTYTNSAFTNAYGTNFTVTNSVGFTNAYQMTYWAALLVNFQQAFDLTINVPDVPIYDIPTNSSLTAANGPYNLTMATNYPSQCAMTTRKLANYPGGRFYANSYNTYFENAGFV